MKVACVFGTRPEIIKMAPVIWAAQERPEISLTTIHTGQHYDAEMSGDFIDELDLPLPDYNLNVGSASSTNQISESMCKLEDIFLQDRPDAVLVQGDTNTIPATCLVARSMKIPLCHVEAGLRSFNERSWEEVNRRIAGVCALYHFAPTELAKSMLLREGTSRERILVTGNTIVDVVARMQPHFRTPDIFVGLPRRRSVIVTLHRAENTDEERNLLEVLGTIEELASQYNIIFPLHPRTRKKLEEIRALGKLEQKEGIRILGPLSYLTFMSILSSVDAVITDSGGVQEEAAILGKPTVTVRPSTPRWETILEGNNHLANTRKDSILRAFADAIEQREKGVAVPSSIFGEPGAGKRIVEILLELYASGRLTYRSPEFVGKSPQEVLAMVRRATR